ncbi:MAG: VCBS repeat-containing protein, partial [Cyclobacteriaceae bacterium]|nr:VCBS repeat-containing protein [Cyclobacteriaceae bacterium]
MSEVNARFDVWKGMGKSVVTLVVLLFITGWVSVAQAQVNEICNDGIDNDGNGLIDCADPFCNFAANVEKGCRCFDAIDNDGDGKKDSADPDCATYYGLSFVGAGSSCSITPPGGNPFTSMAPPQTSAQNTADTPAKISVGDMNNDGMPDIVITSKWNSTVQVVATANVGGFQPGDIMGDFRTPGSNIFPLAGSKYVFEHETAIADINKDKIGELYVIASERGGSPNNKPTKFYLCGFRYANNTLVPLFNAVFLSTDRPGSIGVADFDGDGKAEVYLRNRIYAAESGVLLADGGGNWDRTVNAGPVAVNILGDNKLELVCGPIIYSVPSLASRTLQALTVAKDMNTLGVTYYPKGYNDVNEFGVDQASSTSTADFNGDGFLDVLMTGSINCSGNEAVPCGTNITTIFYWDVQNNTVRTYAPPDAVTPATGWAWGTGRINLGDATGDGKLDALFVAGNKLFCLTLSGGNLTVVWIRTINDSLSGILSVTVYDFDNNGKPEVVYRDANELAVVDGLTGATKLWSAVCQSHTFTEGPVIADVNGDGGTDICVPCYTNAGSFDVTKATPQQQSLGQTRMYFSNTNSWLPTRKVWNQHPYYVTNINDNLTLPFPQLDPSMIFSNAPCPNGLPGPQRPFNIFMNQVPRLSASGCPEFPAPDLTFFGDDPDNPGVDSDGDGVYTPTVVVTPPICGDVTIKAFFNIINTGSLPISDNVPVSFFNGDPTTNPAAVRLFNSTLTVTNLQVGQKLVTPQLSFNGPGTTFDLYIVLYNDGSTLPIVLTGPSTKECSITNNMYHVLVTPDPFTVVVEKVSDNIKCGPNVPPYTGEIRARIFKGAVEVVDYSPYAFQWYDGIGIGTPHAGGTTYHLTSVIDGDYTVVVTNTQKGCASPPISGNVGLSQINPAITLTVTSNQTICSPPNGRIDATIAGGIAGYTFDWYDIALTPLGISGPTATNLLAGNYVVVVSKNGCSTTSAPATVNGPVIPDAQASVVANVVDCLSPNTGSVTAQAVIGGVPQNPASYTFNWYFYNNATSTRGSILPPANGVGPTRTGLAIGYYQVEIKDNVSQCIANQTPVVQVLDQRVLPTATINQVSPQTSCDPLNPNGVLTAVGSAPGLVSPTDFTFEWFKGDNTLPANLHTNVSGVKGETANVVAGGGIFYTVRVTTPSNCSATNKFIIAESLNLPIVTLTSTSNTTCSPVLGTANYTGTVSATATFAGSPIVDFTNYKFVWHSGSLTSDPTIPVANDKLPSLAQLNGGNYTVTLEHLTLACKSVPTTVAVANAFVLPAMVLTPVGSKNCVPGKEDGTAEVTTVDGLPGTNPGYTFAWTGPAAPAFPVTPAANNSNTNKIIKVQGGPGYDYSVLSTNKVTGCQSTQFVNVPDSRVLPVITLATVDNGICNPALTVPAKTFSGKVTATVTNQIGALTDYTFAFGGGMGPGVAAANVYDQLNGGATAYTATSTHTITGCVSAPVSVVVNNAQTLPVLTTSTTASTNCAVGLENGVAEVLTVDGTGVGVATGYTYAWTGSVAPAFPVNNPTNNANTARLIKVQGGAGYNYTVLVTNQGNGCQTSQALNVADAKVLPVITLATVDNGICNPALTVPAKTFSGKVTATVTNQIGALTDYTFAFGGGMGPGVAAANVYDQLNGGATAYTATSTHTITGCVSAPVSVVVNNVQTLPVLTTST